MLIKFLFFVLLFFVFTRSPMILLLLLLLLSLDLVLALDNQCSSRWGLWLTNKPGTLTEGLASCGAMGMEMVPVRYEDDPDDLTNPVLRYMAGRVSAECDCDAFWVDTGLFTNGTVTRVSHEKELLYPALCYHATIPVPANHFTPVNTVHVTTTLSTTRLNTRLFPLQVYVTETASLQPEPSTTAYTTTHVTVTEWTTQTFSTPTVVRFKNLFWETVGETERSVATAVLTGTSTETTTRSITVTTSVIAVTNAVHSLTLTKPCPPSPSTITISDHHDDNQVGQRAAPQELVCDRYSSLVAVKICDQSEGDLVVLSSPSDFGTASCLCSELGLQLANLTTTNIGKARSLLRKCVLDIPDQKAWVASVPFATDELQVCMAIGSRDGPVPCIQELPSICEPITQ
jgi:hypothetical protein